MEIIEFELIEKYARNYTETPIKLIPGALYKSGNYTNHKAEQLSKLLGVGNSSGFRSKNVIKQKKTAYIVATITHENNDWNDTIDFSTSEVIYYGDNAKSNDILLTKQNGNKKLKYLFENSDDPSVQFPLFLFYRDTDCRNRDFKYAGIMVPNYNDNGLEIVENDNGIKNYKAHLTLT